VLLHFTAFDVEEHHYGKCVYDHLNIYDGRNFSATRIAKLCGSEMPEDITSSGNGIFVVFTTDSGDTAKGFTIDYRAVEGT